MAHILPAGANAPTCQESTKPAAVPAVLPVVVAGYVIATLIGVVSNAGVVPLPGIGERVMPLVATFLAGSLVFLVAERLSLTVVTLTVAACWLAVAVILGLVQEAGGLPIAFLLLALGSRTEASSIGRRNDVSYGVYIYAWPVQQMVVLLLGGRGDVWVVILASVAATAPLAYLSCVLVERPALSLARRTEIVSQGVVPVP